MLDRVMLCAAAPLCVVVFLGSVAQAEPVMIRIGWAVAPSHLAPLVDALVKRHPEMFPRYGKSYLAEALRFRGSTPQIQAMAIDDLQIAAFSPTAFALAVTNAHLDLRIVADVMQDHDGYATTRYVVRSDGPIQTIADLKGKRIAINAIGSSADSTLRIVLRRHGIRDSDFTTVEAPFPAMPAMIEGGKVDLIPTVPETAHVIDATGRYRTLFTQREAIGPTQIEIWAMRPQFIAAHHAALVDFFTDHLRALRWFLDPAHHDEAIAIAQDVTKESREDLAYAFTTKDIYRAPDGIPNVAAIQHEIDRQAELGVLPKPITVKPGYLDLSLVEEAGHHMAAR